MSLRLEDMRVQTKDFCMEFVELNKSHPTLGELYIFYTKDVELPKDEASTGWYHMLCKVDRISQSLEG